LVYAYSARRLRNRTETEDLTAEVFRKALQSLPRFKWTGAPFAAWLFRIASNLIADRAKRAAREGSAEPSLTAGLASPGQPGSTQTQQTDLEECERRAELFRLLGELAEDQQRVVIMRFTEDKSIREIANQLDRSEGAVKQLQFRALQTLRKKITPEDTDKRKSER
jgi:RNA polymerase sigma-70 factor (ECF subfamily)